MHNHKPEQKDITLKHPSGDISSLTMRRPKVADLMASTTSSPDDTEQVVNLLANLCMVTPETIDGMDAADFKRVNDAFAELTRMEPVKEYQPEKPIPLGFPVTIAGGTKVTAITLRRAKVKDLKEARKKSPTQTGQEVALFAALSGLDEAAIHSLDWADYLVLKGIYDDFLG